MEEKNQQKAVCGMMKQTCSKCSKKVILTYEFGLCNDCFNKLPEKKENNVQLN